MGARDGATQGVLPHTTYDVCTTGILILYSSSTDHKLILGTHNKYLHVRCIDGRPRDALNRKNEEAAAAAAPSSSLYHMQSNSDSHGQHQICLEREIKKNREK